MNKRVGLAELGIKNYMAFERVIYNLYFKRVTSITMKKYILPSGPLETVKINNNKYITTITMKSLCTNSDYMKDLKNFRDLKN